MMTLYEFIKYEGLKRNLSIRDLAAEAGLTYPTIYRLKKKEPSRQTYYKLSKFLDITIAELLEYPILK